MSDAELLAAVEGHRWLQSLRLRPDLLTPGLKPEAELQEEEAALLDPLNLKGAHVLEVGAANGAFSFAALRRGAARVLATDAGIVKLSPDHAWEAPDATRGEA